MNRCVPVGIGRFAVLTTPVFLLLLSQTVNMASITILAENMGTPPGTTAIGGHTFQNDGTLSFIGTGDVRSTSSSSGYEGASGGGNIFLTADTATRDFEIGSISTIGYASLFLSFGAYKSTTASTMSELVVSYSVDGGSTYSFLPAITQPAGSGTAVWRLITGFALPTDSEGISGLRLRWENIATSGPAFRLDDIILTGAAVPEPSTLIAGALLALPFGLQGFRYLRNRKRA